MRRRSLRAGTIRRAARRSADILSVRIGAVFIVAALPLVLLLGFWAPSERSYPLIVLATLIGVIVAVSGLAYVVASPLRRIGAGINRWRGGEAFNSRGLGYLPREFRSVALSFRRSTLVLARRERELQRAIEQQELAMQEIHHRVKNNLQIVASLLNLQASRIRLPAARAEFQSARDRVRALATVHRHLYAHGELHTINMRSFLFDLCRPLFQAMGDPDSNQIKLEIEAPEVQMSSDQAVPLSLIVTEAVTNALKYGFPDNRRGTVAISLTRDGEDVLLDIHDDGVGIPAGRAETESGPRDGIGMQLIRGFARQLGATLTLQEGNGTRYLVRMKLRQQRLTVLPPLGRARASAE